MIDVSVCIDSWQLSKLITQVREYILKQDCILSKGPMPTTFSVPKRKNPKVRGVQEEEEEKDKNNTIKSQSEDPCYCNGHG